MADEFLFSVAGPTAEPLPKISLADAGFYERAHLQEWVIANPEIIGPGTVIVSFEYDRWIGPRNVMPRDRLDVLGLSTSGRLIVAELKAVEAPESVTLQALTYAAMAARFTEDDVAEAYARLSTSRFKRSLTREEARRALQDHCSASMSPETLADPIIVLLALGFPPQVTNAVDWLAGKGIDLRLVQFQPYRSNGGEVVVSFSQIYPLRDVSDMWVRPIGTAAVPEAMPQVASSCDDLLHLGRRASSTVQTFLNACAERSEEWVPLSDIAARAGRSVVQASGELGGLTVLTRRYFGRNNWPFEYNLSTPAAYKMDARTADAWKAASSELFAENAGQSPPLQSKSDV